MNAPSLTGFLAMTEAKFRLFDLGLYLRKLPTSVLNQLDDGQPYPLPHLGYAWLSIFMWNPELPEQNSLWFLKLPLDEQGILPAAVHSDLVSRLYRALQATDEKERHRLLTDHPYQFKPDHQKMAALHATATQLLGLPVSDYFEPAQQFYLQRTTSVEWPQLGIQGIADLVCNLSDDDFSILSKSISSLESEPLVALLQQLEHRTLPTRIVEVICKLAQSAGDNDALFVACLRAVAQSPAARLIENSILDRLESDKVSTEFLLTVITRYFTLLTEDSFAVSILNNLAMHLDDDSFARVMTNLAMQANMSGIVMKTLASPTLTKTLANALSTLIKQKRRTPHAPH